MSAGYILVLLGRHKEFIALRPYSCIVFISVGFIRFRTMGL